ncbi:hypothetical protein EV356DRAFT_144506 [Viridothelium virens]|uniref:Uncharacterized protein n=1 Tax=Viridothelium virens TaxID=1048519 RepID=A0A6A6H9K2_VIRVR|nr:hypothetical protein EV356DRAFT_144506 [Viridothelium virens]
MVRRSDQMPFPPFQSSYALVIALLECLAKPCPRKYGCMLRSQTRNYRTGAKIAGLVQADKMSLVTNQLSELFPVPSINSGSNCNSAVSHENNRENEKWSNEGLAN